MFVNLYLLAGLLLHKIVWEVLKRKQGNGALISAPPPSLKLRIVKAAKILVLIAITIQTLAPPVLPINNAPRWLAWLGVLVFTAGLTLAISARIELGRNWSDIEVGAVRRDHHIVESGVYRHIRHPIYVGDLALLAGLELALNSWLVAGALLLIPVVLRKALAEEKTLVRSLPGYAEYCARTSPFIGLRNTHPVES